MIGTERVSVTVPRVLLSFVKENRDVSSSASATIVTASNSEEQTFYVTMEAVFWSSGIRHMSSSPMEVALPRLSKSFKTDF